MTGTSVHSINVCECGAIMYQCRCPSPNKPRRVVCQECRKCKPPPAPAPPAVCDGESEQAWRVGRRVGRTVYRGDDLIGMMDTPALATAVVAAMNGRTQAAPQLQDNEDLKALCGRIIAAQLAAGYTPLSAADIVLEAVTGFLVGCDTREFEPPGSTPFARR